MKLFLVVFLAVSVCTLVVSSQKLTPQERQQLCYIESIAEAARLNGLGDEWSKAEPEIRAHLADLMHRIKKDGIFGALLYVVKKVDIRNRVLSDFLSSVENHPNNKKFKYDANWIIKQREC